MKVLIHQTRTDQVIATFEVDTPTKLLARIEEEMSNYTGAPLSVLKSAVGDHTASVLVGQTLFDNFKFVIEYHDSMRT